VITQPRKKFIQIVGTPNYLVQKNKRNRDLRSSARIVV
jgi:hypothetical protein